MSSLFSRRILITRPKDLSQELEILLKEQGADVLLFPTLEMNALEDNSALIEGVNALKEASYGIFVSPSAVAFSAPLIKAHYPTLPAHLTFIAQGFGTAKALKNYGWPSLIPQEEPHNSESLLKIPQLSQVQGKTLVFFCGLGGKITIPNTLSERGAKVVTAYAYERCCPSENRNTLLTSLKNQPVDLIISTSGESLRNLVHLLGPQGLSYFQETPLLVVSPAMVNMARDFGHKSHILLLDRVSPEAITEKIVEWFQRGA